ncbi:hypothetical protein F4823DRAFT_598047 [Ustulina deusta]|nr:hypothetical protein F4823DRAFT_598047 [Ustulina deusta]
MKYTISSLPDTDVHETQEKLDSLVNVPQSLNSVPFHTYFSVFLKATGELIGDGGVHTKASSACGWPELG